MRLLLLITLLSYSIVAQMNTDTIVNIQDIDDNIKVELKYSTEDNFLGEDVYGDLDECYLQREAAQKLAVAQDILAHKKRGYTLLVYDGLRPRDVQQKMWDFVKGSDQQKYVANPKRGSIHNYGAAVDLTIEDSNGVVLDMGTAFDFFGKLAQPRMEKKFLKSGELTEKHIENRELLREVMREAGFTGISVEWWHFNAFPKKEVKEKYEIVETIK